MSKTRTKTGEGVLVDEVRENAVDKYLLRFRRRVLLLLLILIVALAVWCYYRCGRCERRGGTAPAYGSVPARTSAEGAGA